MTQSECLRDGWRRARDAWPGVDLELDAFAERVAELGDSGDALHALHLTDVYLATACARGVRQAAETFDRAILAHVGAFVRRIDASNAFADEARQHLREKLLMGDATRQPRIVEYAGRGSLLSWVRVAATRTALNMRRAHRSARDAQRGDAVAEEATGDDPELRVIHHQDHAAFTRAVTTAIAELSPDVRAATRMAASGLTTAEIGKRFDVNQSTIVRWLATGRTLIRRATCKVLQEQLRLSATECEDLMARAVTRADLPATVFVNALAC